MDGGGHMHNDERVAEKLMDDHLKSLGLHRKKIAKDGSCLFRAVAEQVLHCQSLHTKVRAKCVEFLKQNRESYEAFIEGDFDDYLVKLQDPQQWVGEVEISALAAMYKRDFLIFQEPGKPAVNITDNNFKDKVQLCFLNGNHYDSVYPISHIKSAALCQSVLYEMLYDRVFKVDRNSLGPCHRVGRPNDVLSDDSMPVCASSDDSDLDAGETPWVENGTSTSSSSSSTRHNQSYRSRGRGRQLPERVRRSLNPTLFRNVDYDVWHKSKRAQQKMDYRIAAGMQYTVGDRCQVRLESGGRSYNATVKEVPPNNNMVTVYIEELGKRHVPLWSLLPPSDEGSWSTVVSKDKRLSNGHGDWEERGKGRGRGKQVPPSSSVSQATAPSSSGRVVKQHSWPPQATVEEQGGAKSSRKSVSSAEAAFGLTKEQRLAKEEEERNVALVEIQLRDEHSFPALGTGAQGDGGRRKGVEKKRSQRNKMKSPVEEVRAASPSAGERPKSSTPPPATTTATTAPTANTTTPTSPALPAAKPAAAASSASSSSSPAWLSSLKASTPSVNMAATASGSASTPTPTRAAPTAKTNAQSYALAAGATSSSPPPAAAPSTKAFMTGGAPPASVPSSATIFSCLTPVLPAASSPPNPPALSSSSPPPSSSSSPPPKSSASPPPRSSVPPPTFIAPIAPSPIIAQGFLPPSSLPRSSPPVSSLPHSPSPPASSSLIHHAGKVEEAPPAAAQTQSSLPDFGGSQAASQTFQSQTSLSQIHPQVSLPPNQSQISVSQTQTQASVTQEGIQMQSSLPKIQTESQAPPPQSQTLMPQKQIPEAPSSPSPQSLTEATPAVPQNQIQASVLKTQASLPQAQYPSQLPHPSLSISTSPTHPSVQIQTPSTHNQTEAPRPPDQHPQPESHPPLSHHPQLLSAHPLPPPHPQSLPGAVPLQKLSQLYQDPLYPGFPQGEKGDIAPTPPYSSSKSGDDLPQDVNILRFFYNLGVKAFSMPMFPPYIYLLPLQQAHAMHPKLPSRSRSPSPTPHFPPASAPTRHQESYPQYPPASASALPQYEHQAPFTEPPHPSEPSFNQAGYPVTQPTPHRVPCTSLQWQQHQMPPPRNSSYPVVYPSTAPTYPVPPPSSQGYHPGQGPGHSLYPPTMPPYSPSPLGYQSSSTPEELQMSQGAMEQLQSNNGDTMPVHGPGRVPAPLEGPAAANNRAMGVPGGNGFALKKEQGDSGTRAVLLVDPPLNNTPIVALVSNCDVNDVPVSMTTMKPSSTPGSPSPYGIISKTTVCGDNTSLAYRVHQKTYNPSKTFKVGHLLTAPMAEALSVGCSTEDSWEEMEGFRQANMSIRGSRRNYRGGVRGRGGAHDGGRGGQRRRQGGEAGAGFNFVQFGPSHRGRAW